jgi:outer membrane protein assembly factor BamB
MGHRREKQRRLGRYYIVVLARLSPISCVVAGVFVFVACLGAQRTGRRAPLLPPLLPAEEAWRAVLPAAPSADGALDAECVYIPLDNGRVMALDRDTGAHRWTAVLLTRWPPLVAEGQVFIAASHEIAALDLATGSTRWRAVLPREVIGPMAMGAGRLLVRVSPDEVWALHPADGSELWRRALEGQAGAGGIATDRSSAYVSMPGAVVSVALVDGRLRWRRPLLGSLSAPAVARDRVFVGSTANVLYALDAHTGSHVWHWRTGGDVVGAGVEGDRVYYATLDNILFAINWGNGNQRWKEELQMRPVAPPSAFGGIVVVSGIDRLATFDAQTGARIAVWNAPDRLQGAPLVDGALKPFRVAIVAITRDGRVIGLRPTGMLFAEGAAAPLVALPGRPLLREPRPDHTQP